VTHALPIALYLIAGIGTLAVCRRLCGPAPDTVTAVGVVIVWPPVALLLAGAAVVGFVKWVGGVK